MALGKRIGCVTVSLIAAVPVAMLVGTLAIMLPRPSPLHAAAADPAFERECAEAARLGFGLVTRSPSPVPVEASPAPIDLTLGAGECVALVAVAWGFQQVASVGIYETSPGVVPVELSSHTPDGGLVGHTQWCADTPANIQLQVALSGRDALSREGSTQGYLRMALYRGPGASFGGLRGITRGKLAERAVRRVSAASLLADADRRAPPGEPLLTRELPIDPAAAILIPEDAMTYRLLHDAARNGTTRAVNPRVSPLPLDVPAAWRPAAMPGVVTSIAALRTRVATDAAPAEQFPLYAIGGKAWRTLAIIDATRLGVPCADLRFVRLLFGHRAAVGRATSTRASQTALPQVENEAQDRLCAAQGTVAYVVPPEDHESYRLRVYVAR